MDLGAFSISLNVKDIHASKAFYEKLGFEAFGGDIDQNWLILKNGRHVIGLFQGMFDKNLLTFNPGWDQAAQPVDPFTDVRQIQKALKEAGLSPEPEADPATTGPAYAAVQILADAIGRANSLERDKIRDAIAATNMTAVIGPVKFNPDGTGQVVTIINQWQDGKQQLVWPADQAVGPVAYPAKAWNER